MSDKELLTAINAAIKRFTGYGPRLESAIGALFVGKAMGWEVLYLMHNISTLKKYEEILGFSLRDQMEPSTPLSRKNYSWRFANEKGSFWKLIRGEIKRDDRTELHDLSSSPKEE